MTAANATPRARAIRKRRPWLLALAALAVGGVLTLGVALAVRRPPAVPVPAVEGVDADPAVAAAYRSARDAVLASPRSATAWGHYGMFLLTCECSAQSRACFAEAARLDPLEPRWPYYHALTFVADDPPQAIADLGRVVELCGDTPDVPRLLLADLLLEAGRLDEAEAHLLKALAAHPGSARAEFGLGRLAVERGDLRGGAEHLRRAAANRYTARGAHALLAQVLRRLDDGPGARREQEAAAAGDSRPSWPDPWVAELNALRVGRRAGADLVSELLGAGRAAEARAAAERLTRAYPEAGNSWLLLGQACLQQNDYRAAEPALRRAVDLMPGSVEAHFELGAALFQEEDHAAAAEQFRLAVEAKPASATSWFNLGRCLLRLGDEDDAADALRKAVEYRPQFAEAHRELGELLARRGDRAAAVEHLGIAVRLNPRDEDARRRVQELRKQAADAATASGKPCH